MNKALQLFDGHYVLKTYRKKIMAGLPECKNIKNIEVVKHKSHVWENTYHVVVEYSICFKTGDGREKTVSIFCSAHSCEPRKNVYDSLKFLWKNGFNDLDGNKLMVPRPLFYSNNFKGTFYVGAAGTNLYCLIKEKKLEDVETVVMQTAAWFAKLHSLPTGEARNFNRDNSRIKTVKPGMQNIFAKIQEHYPEMYQRYKKAYETVNRQEMKFLNGTEKRWLVHGDAHPENIIKMAEGKIAVIDFSDLSLSDFARDIGSFLQQVEFKIMCRIGDEKYAARIKQVFLDNYLENAKIRLTEQLKGRIDNYYNWTLLRTVAFFLTKHHPLPERAEKLLNSLNEKPL